MTRQISRAEAWERVHEAFTQVNFNSFDYNTIKESLLDYTKLYFPEDFNDYIESSEFIALLEIFAYVGELLAYRMDVNAHENFFSTAVRKESILRLAKFISYKATRNIPARGLVKITSVQTTERTLDSRGRNVANTRIAWNDGNNPDWKEQFLLVLNKFLEQEFGTVAPNERIQVDDVLFELYTLNNTPTSTGSSSVIKYNANVNGSSYPMELTPIQLTEYGPEERRPERSAKMSILYGSDGLGDGSDTTGFFLFTKQGTLRVQEQFFDGVTPNQIVDITADNINETDVWVNNVSPTTRAIVETDPIQTILPHFKFGDTRFGEWVEVDIANAQNIIFNTNANRHKYEIESLDNDNIRLVFGDGEFSDVPSGAFDIWYRISANEDISIPQSSVVDKTASFSYLDSTGAVQTAVISFSLINSLQNASPSEDLEHIRRVASSVYYTQDRMVNGRDYNVYMLQDPSILKLRSINRTFAGDSKYIAWHDPKEYYEDVKMFGDDLGIYWVNNDPIDGNSTTVSGSYSAQQVLINYIQPLLCNTDFFAVVTSEIERLKSVYSVGSPIQTVSTTPRCSFTTSETDAIIAALEASTTNEPDIDLYYSATYDDWTVGVHPCDLPTGSPLTGCSTPAESIWMVRIEANFADNGTLQSWTVRSYSRHLVAHSELTKFWNTNSANRVINLNTLSSLGDEIVVLQANATSNGTELLDQNYSFTVLGQEVIDDVTLGAGLPDIHRLSILPGDLNGDSIPDNLNQEPLLETQYTITTFGSPSEIILPNSKFFVVSTDANMDEEIEVYIDRVRYTFADGSLLPSSVDINGLAYGIYVPSVPVLSGSTVVVIIRSQVYLYRASTTDSWAPQPANIDTIAAWTLDLTEQYYKRVPGRYPLNFAWFHSTPNLHLVDPAASNIIDTFITTRGYYTELRRYLENRTTVAPTAPTPRELRASYAPMLESKMISDTMILHPGKFRILFGPKAIPQLRATFKIVRPTTTSITDNEVKVRIVSAVRSFFDINDWEYGETFYFTELSAAIHADLGPEIDSIVIVPTSSQNYFGDLFQIQAREDELFIPDINTSDIQVVQSLTSDTIRQKT